METVKTVNETGSVEIEDVTVNFNWSYQDGEMPSRINAQANSESMNYNGSYNLSDGSMEVQFYNLKSYMPTAFLQGVKAEFEAIKNSFNSAIE